MMIQRHPVRELVETATIYPVGLRYGANPLVDRISGSCFTSSELRRDSFAKVHRGLGGDE